MNNKTINVGEIDISGDSPEQRLDAEQTVKLSPEELAHRDRLTKILFTSMTRSNGNWKRRFKGFPSHGKVKPIKFWYYGKLISKEEHDSLPIEEILEHNNRVTGRKYS